ncbi:universal stress protein [Haloparvum sedimenti]|uniref:universal stress protein n=1 Tax=Haloparvum sedimenti TaxID=1678448 RepID=UPI00071E71CB|nr:universal stress protein [Haloparvum sedimenti]
MNAEDAAGGDDEERLPGEPATVDTLADVAGLANGVSSVTSVEVRCPSDAEPPERVSSILVAVGGGPHAAATVDLARALAEETDAWLELFHVATDDVDDEALLDDATARLGEFERVDRWVVEEGAPASAIVEQSAYYDAVVLGSSTRGRVERFVRGSTTATVAERAASPVVVVSGDGATPI